MSEFNAHQLKIKEMFNRDELRRLEKAAKDKNKTKLIDWANQFEDQLRQEYENAFKQELSDAIDNFVLTIVYTLHFNEKTKFGGKRIDDFMSDLFVTIDYFRTNEYSPEEYREQLLQDGINVINRKEKENDRRMERH